MIEMQYIRSLERQTLEIRYLEKVSIVSIKISGLKVIIRKESAFYDVDFPIIKILKNMIQVYIYIYIYIYIITLLIINYYLETI